MRILFARFPLESAFGGAEVQTLSLMKGLREKGHEVRFLGSCPVLLKRTRDLGLGTTELNIGIPPVTKWGATSFLWRKRKMQKKLVSAVKVAWVSDPCFGDPSLSVGMIPAPPDAIFMLSLSEKLLLTEWAHSKGIKVFWIEHDRIGRWLTKNPWLPRLRKLSRLATTITVSDLSRDLYLEMGWDPEKTISIPNGVDVKRFGVMQHGPEGHATFHVGCIARLTHDKGVDLLIEAVKDLPNVTLTIVGQGKEERTLHQRAEEVNQQTPLRSSSSSGTSYEGQASKPHFARPPRAGQATRGRPANQQTSPRIRILPTTNPTIFYKEIDCLVLPSHSHDPFGLVIAEAMASGVPTILTDACGIAHHLSPEDAIIVPAGKSGALREALKKVQEKEVWERLALRGLVVAQEKFSLEHMVEAYVALL